jgi:hypothetical protein
MNVDMDPWSHQYFEEKNLKIIAGQLHEDCSTPDTRKTSGETEEVPVTKSGSEDLQPRKKPSPPGSSLHKSISTWAKPLKFSFTNPEDHTTSSDSDGKSRTSSENIDNSFGSTSMKIPRNPKNYNHKKAREVVTKEPKSRTQNPDGRTIFSTRKTLGST